MLAVSRSGRAARGTNHLWMRRAFRCVWNPGFIVYAVFGAVPVHPHKASISHCSDGCCYIPILLHEPEPRLLWNKGLCHGPERNCSMGNLKQRSKWPLNRERSAFDSKAFAVFHSFEIIQFAWGSCALGGDRHTHGKLPVNTQVIAVGLYSLWNQKNGD